MLESKIDDLYRKPLNEFISARSALASEHKGDDGRRIKALKKPTLVPWAVNQVYWHARPIFDRVQASGADLRRAQIAALEGRKADVQAAAAAHRKAIGCGGRARHDAGQSRTDEPGPRRGRPHVRSAVDRLRTAGATGPPDPAAAAWRLRAACRRRADGEGVRGWHAHKRRSRHPVIAWHAHARACPPRIAEEDGLETVPAESSKPAIRRPRRGGTRRRRPRARTCPGRCRPPARCGDRQAGARGRAREATGGTGAPRLGPGDRRAQRRRAAPQRSAPSTTSRVDSPHVSARPDAPFLAALGRAGRRRRRHRDHRRRSFSHHAHRPLRPVGAGPDDRAGRPDAARPPALPGAEPVHDRGDARFRRRDEESRRCGFSPSSTSR